MKLLVRECSNIFIRFTLPDKSCFILTMGLQVTVQTVIADIYLTADEEFNKRIILEIILQEFIPFLIPFQLLGQLAPETLWVSY